MQIIFWVNKMVWSFLYWFVTGITDFHSSFYSYIFWYLYYIVIVISITFALNKILKPLVTVSYTVHMSTLLIYIYYSCMNGIIFWSPSQDFFYLYRGNQFCNDRGSWSAQKPLTIRRRTDKLSHTKICDNGSGIWILRCG